MGKKYNPIDHSVVQLVTGEPFESLEATDFHEALLFAIGREIGRVHWNRYQKEWTRWSDDPNIPGIRWRRYMYDCDCQEDNDGFIPRHEDGCSINSPNFEFDGVCFRWYKNPGRGMSVNKEMPSGAWVAWFNDCIKKIREFDSEHSGGYWRETISPAAAKTLLTEHKYCLDCINGRLCGRAEYLREKSNA